jgi:Tfp pilus assembly protein PilV
MIHHLHAVPAVRQGLSLLEVLLALAIFLFSLVAIGHLVTLAGDRAADIQLRARASQLCQSKLGEVAAGVVPLSQPQANVPFDEDPDWQWSMDAQQGSTIPNLWTVSIHVSRQRLNGPPVEASITQMMLDPSVRGSASSTATSSGSSTSGQASSSTGSGTTGSTGMASPSGIGSGAMGSPKGGP